MKPHRIKITYKSFEKFKSEYDRHLSKGWQFVKTPRPLPEESLVELVLTIPGKTDPLVIPGEVVRRTGEDNTENGKNQGFFVGFVDFVSARIELDRLVSIVPPDTMTTRDDPHEEHDPRTEDIDKPETEDTDENTSERDTELLSTRIRNLSVKEKMMLAPKAAKNERAILIRDGNSSVIRMIVRNPRIGDSEIARIARDVSTPADVLDQIGNNRKWVQNQEVRLAIVKNPRTPTSLALRQLPFLPPKDISALAKSQHVKDSIKREALKLVIKRHERG